MLACFQGFTQARLFELDRSHSSITFTVDYLGMMTQRGEFGSFEAALVYDSTNLEGTSVTIIVNASSIDTNHNFRDNHLRSPDFLNTEAFPEIKFESTGYSIRDGGSYIEGNLELHGTTQKIEVLLQSSGEYTDWDGKQRVGFTGTFSIDRKRFGIIGGNKFNPRFVKDRVIGDTVMIDFSIQGVLRTSTTWEPAVLLLDEIRDRGFSTRLETQMTTDLSGEKSQVQEQIIRYYTVSNALIYDNERVMDAIRMLNLLVQNEFISDRYKTNVLQSLAIGHWQSGNDSLALAFLNKIPVNTRTQPFVNEMNKFLDR